MARCHNFSGEGTNPNM